MTRIPTVESGPSTHSSNQRATEPMVGNTPISDANRVKPPRWQRSPFYSFREAVSTLGVASDVQGSQDTRVIQLTFTLSRYSLAQLQRPSSRYQLRLYCTSSRHYDPSKDQSSCPISFPRRAEIRINGQKLLISNRGVRNKPGSMPPPDVTPLILGDNTRGQHHIEMSYTPIGSERRETYYLTVNLIKYTPPDRILEEGRVNNEIESKEGLFSRLKAQQSNGDDVLVGPMKVSLKDPISLTRIKIPYRTQYCVHVQCFDAHCWFASMEQASTWECPICPARLGREGLMFDRFLSDILDKVPNDVEYIIVNPDGEWHTEDNTHGSPAWMEQQRATDTEISASEVGELDCLTTEKQDTRTRPEPEVIDLTHDDPEEEQSPPQGPSVTHQVEPLNGDQVAEEEPSIDVAFLAKPPDQSNNSYVAVKIAATVLVTALAFTGASHIASTGLPGLPLQEICQYSVYPIAVGARYFGTIRSALLAKTQTP